MEIKTAAICRRCRNHPNIASGNRIEIYLSKNGRQACATCDYVRPLPYKIKFNDFQIVFETERMIEGKATIVKVD